MDNEKEIKRLAGIRRFFLKVFVIITILVLIFSPYLLIVDFKKYLPFVATVWVISASYFMFVKTRKDREDEKTNAESKE